MNTHPNGYFVISLDFELFWGMIDKETIDSYGERVLGERTAIPRMLTLFESYGIHATWATVGMLMARSEKELRTFLPPPHLQPHYPDPRMSSYEYLQTDAVGDDESSDPYHFGAGLIQMILDTPHQEIGNHTFSHYYCLDGDTNSSDIFARDLEAHRAIARTHGIETRTIVFPRNQARTDILATCATYGIRAYRGTEDHFLYRARKEEDQTLFVRGLRLLDHYINISGHHTYPLPHQHEHGLYNLKASRFLRPWNPALRFLESLRMHRIKKSMTYAARHGEIFHLWWHPNNVGADIDHNMQNLVVLLDHYKKLHTKYGWQSANMDDLVRIIDATTVTQR